MKTIRKTGIIAYYQLSAAERNIYQKTEAALRKHEQFFYMETSPIVMNKIFRSILNDSPELFWFEGRWKKESLYDRDVIVPCYTMSINETESAIQKMNRQIKQFCYLKRLDDLSKARGLYEWMVCNVKYGMKMSRGQTAYDALINRIAVCKGIAKAYQLILADLEVLSVLKEGTLGGRSKHIWNEVLINGKWYSIDICMGYDKFRYFFEEDRQKDMFRGFALSERDISKIYNKF